MDHPLPYMLCSYYDEYPILREQNQDLDNLNFHKQFGLCLGVPANWPLVSSIFNLVESIKEDKASTVVIYPSTSAYNLMYDAFKSTSKEITFFSWQELYVAMARAGKDSRELQRFRYILQGTNLAIFFGAPSGVPEVVDQVRGFCEGCLIVFQ